MKQIWIPEIYLWNRTSVKQKEEWASLETLKLVASNDVFHESNQDAKTMVEMKYEIKTDLYCIFQYSKYPMDSQSCSVKIGSGSGGAIFALFDKAGIYHKSMEYDAVGLSIHVDFFGDETSDGENTVGFNITMKRLTRTYLLKYYLPCIAVVFVSTISFIVPLTAVPGRVALLVTQFLTLVNLFIFQMVR